MLSPLAYRKTATFCFQLMALCYFLRQFFKELVLRIMQNNHAKNFGGSAESNLGPRWKQFKKECSPSELAGPS